MKGLTVQPSNRPTVQQPNRPTVQAIKHTAVEGRPVCPYTTPGQMSYAEKGAKSALDVGLDLGQRADKL